MNNPFESGHIKNYILMYASVVVIMILFFVAATLYRDGSSKGTKSFETKAQSVRVEVSNTQEEKKAEVKKESKIKLLDKAY